MDPVSFWCLLMDPSLVIRKDFLSASAALPALSNLGKLPPVLHIVFPTFISPLGWLLSGTEHSSRFWGCWQVSSRSKASAVSLQTPLYIHTHINFFFFLTKMNTIIWKSWSGPDPSSNVLSPSKGQSPSSARSQSARAYVRFVSRVPTLLFWRFLRCGLTRGKEVGRVCLWSAPLYSFVP